MVLDLPTEEGWKAELTLVVVYIPRWFTCLQTVTHPSSNHLIATRPGVEATTSWSQVQRPYRYTTKPPSEYKWMNLLQSCLLPANVLIWIFFPFFLFLVLFMLFVHLLSIRDSDRLWFWFVRTVAMDCIAFVGHFLCAHENSRIAALSSMKFCVHNALATRGRYLALSKAWLSCVLLVQGVGQVFSWTAVPVRQPHHEVWPWTYHREHSTIPRSRCLLYEWPTTGATTTTTTSTTTDCLLRFLVPVKFY